MELSQLCRINVCMICLGPLESKGMSIEPVTWPHESSKVQEMIQDYQSRSDAEQDCRKSDLLGFLESKKRKLEKEYDRLKKHTASKLHPSWDPRLDDYSEEQRRELVLKIDSRLAVMKHAIEFWEWNTNPSFLSSASNEESRTLMVQNQVALISEEQVKEIIMEIDPRNAIMNQEISFQEGNTYVPFPCSANSEESRALAVDDQQGQQLVFDPIPAVGPRYPTQEPLNRGGIFFNHTGSGLDTSPSLVYSEAATNYNFVVTPAANTLTSNYALGFSAALQNNMDMDCCSLGNQYPIALTSSVGTPLLPHMVIIPYPFTAQPIPMQQADAIPSQMNQNNYGCVHCNYT